MIESRFMRKRYIGYFASALVLSLVKLSVIAIDSKNSNLDTIQKSDLRVVEDKLTTKLNSDSGFIRKSPRERAEKFLNRLATETGGRVFFSQTPKELGDSVSEVVRNLQTSFLLTYRSSNTSSRKGFRKVSVKVTSTGQPKRSIIASPGYFFTPSQSVSNSKPLSKQP